VGALLVGQGIMTPQTSYHTNCTLRDRSDGMGHNRASGARYALLRPGMGGLTSRSLERT